MAAMLKATSCVAVGDRRRTRLRSAARDVAAARRRSGRDDGPYPRPSNPSAAAAEAPGILISNVSSITA